jgi:hypothetical protein
MGVWRNQTELDVQSTKDGTINSDLERWYAERARSHEVEVSAASISRTQDVTALIEEPAMYAESIRTSEESTCML